MKILKKDIDPAGLGFITLKPEQVEDMWHAYNIIAVGDVVTSATFRKVCWLLVLFGGVIVVCLLFVSLLVVFVWILLVCVLFVLKIPFSHSHTPH
jgi:Flp pilus assembly protein TadB